MAVRNGFCLNVNGYGLSSWGITGNHPIWATVANPSVISDTHYGNFHRDS